MTPGARVTVRDFGAGTVITREDAAERGCLPALHDHQGPRVFVALDDPTPRGLLLRSDAGVYTAEPWEPKRLEVPVSVRGMCKQALAEWDERSGAPGPAELADALRATLAREAELLSRVAELLSRVADLEEQARLTEAEVQLATRRADEERARLTAEAQHHRERCRAACQALVEAVGASGPMNVEDAAQRAADAVARLTAERDEARLYAGDWERAYGKACAGRAEALSQRDLAMTWGAMLVEGASLGTVGVWVDLWNERRLLREARAALRRLHRDMGGDDRERRQALDDSARLIAQWGGDDGE